MKAHSRTCAAILAAMPFFAPSSPAELDVHIEHQLHTGVTTPGGWLICRSTVENLGDDTARDFLTVTLPPGLEFVSATWGDEDPMAGQPVGDPVVHQDRILLLDLEYASSGETRWIHTRMDVAPDVVPETVLTPCVLIGIDGDESRPEDNVACVPVAIMPPGPNLHITKWGEWTDPALKDHVDYTLVFKNLGDQTVSNLWITDTLPTNATWDAFWITDFDPGRLGAFVDSPSTLSWEILYIDPGEMGRIEFGAMPDEPGERFRWYWNTAEIEVPPGEVSPQDNVYEHVLFSGAEVDEVHLQVGSDDSTLWGRAVPGFHVVVTTPFTQVITEVGADLDGSWNIDHAGPVYPGDTIEVRGGMGSHPVTFQGPDPFSAVANATADTVTGQIDHLDGEWLQVELIGGPTVDTQTDDDGNYVADYSAVGYDLQPDSFGEVRYTTHVDYAQVTFHCAWTAASPAFSITGVAVLTNAMTLEWESLAGGPFQVRRGTNCLTPVVDWVIRASGLPATPPLNTYTDTLDDARSQFYSIESP